MSNRAVIVYGGTKGLGGALVRELVHKAAHSAVWYDVVVVAGRSAQVVYPGAQDPRRACKVVGWPVDLSTATWYDLQTQLLKLGVIPVVSVQAAAANLIEPTTSLQLGQIQRLVRLNALSSVEIARAVTHADTPRLEGLRPALINIGSNAADGAGKDSLAYVVSKHALTGVTRSLARDYAGVLSVLQVNPPLMEGTSMSDYIMETYANRWGVGLVEAWRRYAEQQPGREVVPVDTMAEFLCELIVLHHSLQTMHGSILRTGYPS